MILIPLSLSSVGYDLQCQQLTINDFTARLRTEITREHLISLASSFQQGTYDLTSFESLVHLNLSQCCFLQLSMYLGEIPQMNHKPLQGLSNLGNVKEFVQTTDFHVGCGHRRLLVYQGERQRRCLCGHVTSGFSENSIINEDKKLHFSIYSFLSLHWLTPVLETPK